MTERPALVPVDAADLARLRMALERALAGGPPIVPYAAAPFPLPPHDPARLPDGLALAIGTSGSTGAPKLALLTGAALRASAAATHAALGGPGRWLLALPAAHIAGVQVLVRARLADTRAVAVDRRGGFTAAAFVRAAQRLAAGSGPERAYTSLVPAQLARLLADVAGADALTRFDAVLVGGSALSPALRERARAVGVRLVATYGMSETAGGCVYNGLALPGTQVAVEPDGRVRLAGPTLAEGYLGLPARTAKVFVSAAGERWFRTDDLGEVEPDGRLRILGRRDDVIVTGGYKVHPRVVEDAAVMHLPGVTHAVAVGVPDAQWGRALALALVVDSGSGVLGAGEATAWARERLRGELSAHALPRRVIVVDALPERGPGKPDRTAVAALVARQMVGE
ncbi:MAG: o-succinylbenzoate--CoA ligase [Tetrasphaera sp.]